MKEKYLEITQNITLWLIIFACFSINLPTAFMTISSVGILVFCLISGGYKIKFERLKNNPVAVIAIVLFVLYVLSSLYSSASWDDKVKYLLKYEKLLLIPLIVSALSVDRMRAHALNAFLVSSIIILLISYLEWGGWIPHDDSNHEGYIVFKSRIAHGIFIAFAIFLMLNRAIQSNGKIRIFWGILIVFSVLNILFLVNGRTGQVIFLLLIIWLTFEIWKLRAIKYWASLFLAGLILHQVLPPISLHSRLFDTQQELADHQSNGVQTSAGIRMEMYKNTLPLIKEHPLLGGGVGSIANEYQKRAKNNNLIMSEVSNPHNQFILTTQELGVVGLIVLLSMFTLNWIASYKLSYVQDGIAFRGLILTMVIGCLFNSLLMDAGEGNFYCVLAGVLASGYKSQPRSV